MRKEKLFMTFLITSLTLTGCSLSYNRKPNVRAVISVDQSDLIGVLDNTDFKDDDSINETAEYIRETQEKYGFQQAVLERVVDGDTIVVRIDNESVKVRLIGINTPESVAGEEYLEKKGTVNSEEGFKASDVTKAILEDVDTVYLQKDVSDTDKYGRALRYVWLEIPEDINTRTIAENMLNGMLLSVQGEKAAEPVRYEPDTMYADEFDEIYENY